MNIDDALHDQLRRACKISGRSINAQAAYWIRIGMMGELAPEQSYSEITARALREAMESKAAESLTTPSVVAGAVP
ncbi:TA system antitoxin ParD family protein [Sphingopyxis sp. MWB1]|uniref:TA system antitoxin ParD family protein n=1 Tax=Sphingopyxis sp. MWB1 TaxID=1537715 RepID=UPI003FA7E848